MISRVGVCAVLALLCYTTVFAEFKENGPTSLMRNRIGDSRFTFSIGNTTYMLVDITETWRAAQYFCKWIGMDLVSIESEEEQRGIEEAIGGVNASIWTSLNDELEEGVFFWETRAERAGPYFNWALGQPELTPTKNCIVLDEEKKWVLTNCKFYYQYICESRSCECE